MLVSMADSEESTTVEADPDINEAGDLELPGLFVEKWRVWYDAGGAQREVSDVILIDWKVLSGGLSR